MSSIEQVTVQVSYVAPLAGLASFLFSDIESSTRRWENNPDCMAADLALHDRLLRHAVESVGGEVFSHTGDGMIAVFARAGTAVEAAVGGQLALSAAVWSCDSPLRVRMAVHTGPAQHRAGNYFGPTLNRAARLMAIAWGGQIVCSSSAASAANDDLSDAITLIELGEVGLVDFTVSERVFQVAHPDMPTENRPPRVRALAYRTNLPVALTTFVGRPSEVSGIEEALITSRLVSLVGPGGAGKTRLALEAAARAVDRFPDGVHLVDLTPLRDPCLVTDVVAKALSMDTSALVASGRPLVDALCDHLRHRRLLMVLDNCEHLVEAVAKLVHAILATGVGVSVLATSREVLAVPGEVAVRVGGLSLARVGADRAAQVRGSQAVELFCARAAASRAGFTLSDANAGAVARICRRVDGLPLAIELAAARLRILDVRQLAERLDDRFRDLVGGPRTVAPRHRTLEAAIDWSYSLLPEPEKVLLRRLSVFSGSWTLAAVRALSVQVENDLGDLAGDDFVDLMACLVDKSLVVPVPQETAEEPRFRLLETVRQFAAMKLGAGGETEAVRERHRSFLIAAADGRLAEHSDGPWLRWVHGEIDNFRAALEWSAARGDEQAVRALAVPLWFYWLLTGAVESVVWLERAAAAPLDGAVALAVHARIGLASVLRNVGGDADRAEPLLREAIDLGLEAGDDESAGTAMLILALHVGVQGRLAEAESLVAAMVKAFARRERAAWLAWPMSFRAWALLAAGQLGPARAILADCFELVADQPQHYLVPQLLGTRTLLEATAGDVEASQATADEAIAAARNFPGSQVLVMALVRAAEAAVVVSQTARAHRLLDELVTVLRDLGSHRWVAETLEVVAVILGPDRPQAAATCLGAANALRTALREERGALPVLAELTSTASYRVTADIGPEVDSVARCHGAKLHIAEILGLAGEELACISGL